jgi:hypothetical protein
MVCSRGMVLPKIAQMVTLLFSGCYLFRLKSAWPVETWKGVFLDR